MPDNDDQAQKLIESLSGKMVEAILPKITESVEQQIKGISEKNQELLDKLAKTKDDDSKAKLDKLLAAADQQMKDRLNDDGTVNFDKGGQDVRISKADARDVSRYREAKKLASERGVDLVIDRDAS
jgi:uncharacterized protein YoxC